MKCLGSSASNQRDLNRNKLRDINKAFTVGFIVFVGPIAFDIHLVMHFYELIVDRGDARINYQPIELEKNIDFKPFC